MRLRERVVPIEEWLSSEYFLGREAKALRPFWRDKIIQYFRGNLREFIFSGSSRGGKTYAVCILILRYIYEMYCIYEFPTLFGLSPTTVPKILFFSFTKGKASSTGIERLIRMVDSIPWFNEKGKKRRDIDSTLVFSWVEILSGSNISHSVGEDMIGAVIDEANIRKVAKTEAMREAQDLFLEVRMRSTITYSWKGVWKGFCGIISTAESTSSFVDSQLQEAREKGDKFVVEAAVYDTSPEQFSNEKFAVYVGGSEIPAFICDSPSEEVFKEIAEKTGLTVDQFVHVNSDNIVYPPVDLKRFYEEDIEKALSNLSGVSRKGSMSFFRNEKEVLSMFNFSLESPASVECPHIGIYDQFDLLRYIDENVLFRNYHGENVYSHADISEYHDHTGISYLFKNEETGKINALLCSEFFRDVTKTDNSIDQEKLVLLMKFLKELGANLNYVSADRYASTYYLQQAKLLLGNDKAGIFSVDDNPAAYLALLNLARKKVFELYPVKKAIIEFKNLIYDRYSNKIDHPRNRNPKEPEFSKDVSDSLAGATFHIYTREKVSYEDMIVSSEAMKYEGEDFYSGLTESDLENSFYGEVARGADSENVDFFDEQSFYDNLV